MSRIYAGNLDARIYGQELEDKFQIYGLIRWIWVARKSSGYVFIEFDDHRDAQDAIRDVDGKHKWRVELSYYSRCVEGLQVEEVTLCYKIVCESLVWVLCISDSGVWSLLSRERSLYVLTDTTWEEDLASCVCGWYCDHRRYTKEIAEEACISTFRPKILDPWSTF